MAAEHNVSNVAARLGRHSPAVNKQDDPAALPLSYVRSRLQLPIEIPLLLCVATDRESATNILMALLVHIDQYMLDAPDAKSIEALGRQI